MNICNCIEDFSMVSDNKVIGLPVEMTESVVEFIGHDNIIFFDDDVKLENSRITFNGNNSVVFICGVKKHTTKLVVDIYHNSVFYIGKNSNTTRPISVVLSEYKHVIIGDDCLFSTQVVFRNADAHLIYDIESMTRINPSRSIYIGDHVWIGQDVLITKGTQIGSGSLVGAKSVTTHKKLPSNCAYAGSPAKMIKQNIFWLKPCVHAFTKRKTKHYKEFDDDRAIFSADENQITYTQIERGINALKTSDERVEYLKETLYNNENKNRFFIPIPVEQKPIVKFAHKVVKKLRKIFKIKKSKE